MVSPIPYTEVQFSETDNGIDSRYKEGQEVISVQYLSDYLSAFMIIRIYFFYKCYVNYSNYRDPFSKMICKEHNFYPGCFFILKVMNEKSPVKTVILTGCTLIICIWWWILLFELETLITSEATQTVSP